MYCEGFIPSLQNKLLGMRDHHKLRYLLFYLHRFSGTCFITCGYISTHFLPEWPKLDKAIQGRFVIICHSAIIQVSGFRNKTLEQTGKKYNFWRLQVCQDFSSCSAFPNLWVGFNVKMKNLFLVHSLLTTVSTMQIITDSTERWSDSNMFIW